MADTAEEVAFDQSIRAIDRQQWSLDELRSRTGTLLAAAAIVASFLGAQALRGSSVDALAVSALVAFGATVALSLYVLRPLGGVWKFSLGAKTMLEDWADDPERTVADMHRFLAEMLEKHWDSNRKHLDRLYLVFCGAQLALALEVVLWTLKLGGRG
ncbi:MAG: hypothetical protein WKF33_07660 [Thermoleophilaceae bacterium]